MNPALPKTTFCIYNLGQANKGKSRVYSARLKSKFGITKKGRAG